MAERARRLFDLRRSRPESDAAVCEIHVPIKYDLGGRVRNVKAVRRSVERICGEVIDAEPLVRSWNISFFGRYSPPFSGPLHTGSAELAGVTWTYDSTLVIHPIVGVASVDYRFRTREKPSRLADFYDDFVAWKNAAYYTYLAEVDALPPALHDQLAQGSSENTTLHGPAIHRLRATIADALELRPTTYVFHDFRVFFVDLGANLSRSTINSVLMFSVETPSQTPVVRPILMDGVRVESTGWSTVVKCRSGLEHHTVDDTFTMMSVVHAHWFVAKIWINIYDNHIVQSGSRHSRRSMLKLREAQLLLAQDLTDAGDLDQMLKDPAMLRIGRYFAEALDLRDQIESAERRRRVLDEHARELQEFRSANQLESLFAIAAAVGIAALIPALAQVNWNQNVSIATGVITLTFTAMFAINISSVSEWARTLRRVRRRRRE